jgi:hypothetical protein
MNSRCARRVSARRNALGVDWATCVKTTLEVAVDARARSGGGHEHRIGEGARPGAKRRIEQSGEAEYVVDAFSVGCHCGVVNASPHGLTGAALGLLGIFLPGVLLLCPIQRSGFLAC